MSPRISATGICTVCVKPPLVVVNDSVAVRVSPLNRPAGLPVAVGLYTAFVPMAVYAILGSSRVLSVSSTATLAILTGTQLGLVVPDANPAKLATATATLAALVGILLILARLMRLGFVANFYYGADTRNDPKRRLPSR